MQTSEQISELAAALAKAQKAFPAIERNRQVRVSKAGTFLYEFWYATLDHIIESVRAPLADSGLSFAQGIDGSTNGTIIETILMHSSGQWLRTAIPVHWNQGSDNKAQAMGSGITYAKRYALTAILGIVAEDDDDANDAGGDTITTRHDKPKSNRSVDDPNWTGPLNKSTLKDKVRAVWADIDNCQDEAVLPGLLQDNIEIINQCARDLPEWWLSKKSGTPSGLKMVVTAAGKELKVNVRPVVDAAEQSRAPQKQAAE